MSTKLKMSVELTTGEKHDITAIMADLIRFDILRARNNFPSRDESDFLFMGLVSYAALVRTGKLPATTKIEDFLNTLEALEPTEDEEADAEFPAEHSDAEPHSA